MKIVFLDAGTMGTSSLAPIERVGELTAWPNSTPEESIGRVSDCEVLIVNKIKVNDLLLEAAPKLRLVCEAGTGINNIDVDACARHGVIVRMSPAIPRIPLFRKHSCIFLTFWATGPILTMS